MEFAERPPVLGWLAFHRGALEVKCAGLAAAQLIARPLAPSRLSLLGLVRHLNEMERLYLGICLSGEPIVLLYCTEDDPEADSASIAAGHAEADLARWRAESRISDAALARYGTLELQPPDRTATVHWLLQKVIGDYARHDGHAGLIREAIDGQTGE